MNAGAPGPLGTGPPATSDESRNGPGRERSRSPARRRPARGDRGDLCRLGATVRSYLQHLVGHDDADDILQRVFYEVWRHNTRYDPSRSLTAWVLGIARKRAIDHLRRRRNLAVALNDLDDVAGDDGRELAERYARAHEVRAALTRLPDEQREVLVLAYFGRFTQPEIAAHLDVPLGTVKARACRGLRRLAEFLS